MEQNKIEVEFIEKIKKIYEECSGAESFGNTTEFYDEDGVVLMTASEGVEEQGTITFFFTETGESFLYKET